MKCKYVINIYIKKWNKYDLLSLRIRFIISDKTDLIFHKRDYKYNYYYSSNYF